MAARCFCVQDKQSSVAFPIDASKFKCMARKHPADAQGSWRLLWSSGQSDFARLQQRMRPLQAASVQLIGEPGGVPEGRAANVITIAGVLVIELSSGGLCAPC